jgi:hypothetical protein
MHRNVQVRGNQYFRLISNLRASHNLILTLRKVSIFFPGLMHRHQHSALQPHLEHSSTPPWVLVHQSSIAVGTGVLPPGSTYRRALDHRMAARDALGPRINASLAGQLPGLLCWQSLTRHDTSIFSPLYTMEPAPCMQGSPLISLFSSEWTRPAPLEQRHLAISKPE